MFILFRRRKSALATIVVLGLIGILSFKDTGIFIEEFVAVGEDGSEVTFKAGESANILKEREREFTVEKGHEKYKIKRDVLLRTEKNSNIYIVKEQNTKLMDKPNGETIKDLGIGDEIQLASIQGLYGLFTTADNIEGYILLKNLEPKSKEEFITAGRSTVDKTIKGKNNTCYVLAKDEIVLIKDFKDDKFTIIDENGQEFQVPKDYISLRDSKQATSRSGLSRRTLRLNAVVRDAHKALGKPYRSGGTGPDNYDCSGLTYSLYLNSAGIELKRISEDQATNGTPVKKSELIPGDLVFFKASGPNIGHVGLYIGDGNMIHASSGKAGKVITTSIDDPYWYKPRYVTARRIIK